MNGPVENAMQRQSVAFLSYVQTAVASSFQTWQNLELHSRKWWIPAEWLWWLNRAVTNAPNNQTAITRSMQCLSILHFWMCTASLICLVNWSGSLSFTIVRDQLIVLLSWGAYCGYVFASFKVYWQLYRDEWI